MRSQETTEFLLGKYVLPEIGPVPIAAISAADVERAMSALTARGLATATRRRALSMIRLVFDYAIRDRRLSVNVARMVSLPRGGTKREPHWLRPEQLGRLAMSVPERCGPVHPHPRNSTTGRHSSGMAMTSRPSCSGRSQCGSRLVPPRGSDTIRATFTLRRRSRIA